MSKLVIPDNRKELLFSFEAIAKKQCLEDKDGATPEFLQKLLLDLIVEVPASAFDPIQPVDEGILFYHGVVDEGEVLDFQHDLTRTHLNLTKSKPITLNLSSFGGSVYAGLALISTIQDLRRAGRRIHIHVQGTAMSMGSLIVQAADWRTMESSASWMMHEVSYQMRGSTSDHEEERDATVKLQDTLYGLYSARTGQSIEHYREKLKKRNLYLTAQEALSDKLVDAITAPPPFDSTPPRSRKRVCL